MLQRLDALAYFSKLEFGETQPVVSLIRCGIFLDRLAVSERCLFEMLRVEELVAFCNIAVSARAGNQAE